MDSRVMPAIYAESRKGEIKGLLQFLKTTIWALPQPYEVSYEGPNQPYNPRGVTLLYALKQRLGKSTVEFCNLLELMPPVIEAAELRGIPSPRTIDRVEERVDPSYWDALNRILISLQEMGEDLAADKTGLKKSGKLKAWSETPLQDRREYVGFHAIASFKTELIASARFTEGSKHESPVFREMVEDLKKVLAGREGEEEVEQKPEEIKVKRVRDSMRREKGRKEGSNGKAEVNGDGEIESAEGEGESPKFSMSADGNYASRENCEKVAETGGKSYFSPPKNATRHARGSIAWLAMMVLYQLRKEEFLEKYHKREIIEAIFWSFKSMFGDLVRSRVRDRMIVELKAKVCVYNAQILVRKGVSPLP